jgi:hypothetical protein
MNAMKDKFIINLFGTGIRYWNCEVAHEVFDDMNRIREKNRVEWEQVLFDLDFLHHYGYDHWSELAKSSANTSTEATRSGGFLLEAQNRIEIKKGGKLLTRYRANELDTAVTLFPIYSTTFHEETLEQQEGRKSFQLIQFEKGLIGKFKFEAEQFSIEDLHYHLSRIDTKTFLSHIQLATALLESSQEDCLVVGSVVRIES